MSLSSDLEEEKNYIISQMSMYFPRIKSHGKGTSIGARTRGMSAPKVLLQQYLDKVKLSLFYLFVSLP